MGFMNRYLSPAVDGLAGAGARPSTAMKRNQPFVDFNTQILTRKEVEKIVRKMLGYELGMKLLDGTRDAKERDNPGYEVLARVIKALDNAGRWEEVDFFRTLKSWVLAHRPKKQSYTVSELDDLGYLIRKIIKEKHGIKGKIDVLVKGLPAHGDEAIGRSIETTYDFNGVQATVNNLYAAGFCPAHISFGLKDGQTHPNAADKLLRNAILGEHPAWSPKRIAKIISDARQMADLR